MNFDYQPILKGTTLELRPLLATDFDDLFMVASDPLIWQQHPVNNRYEKGQFSNYFTECLDAGGTLIVVDSQTNKIIGASRFQCYGQMNDEIEIIGWTFLARSYWGGVYNKEMKQLMLKHAFRYVNRVYLLVGSNNIRSQQAVEKIGAVRVAVNSEGNGSKSFVYQVIKPK
jgi:RimJ/RimL family protein N-acetyltransferase